MKFLPSFPSREKWPMLIKVIGALVGVVLLYLLQPILTPVDKRVLMAIAWILFLYYCFGACLFIRRMEQLEEFVEAAYLMQLAGGSILTGSGIIASTVYLFDIPKLWGALTITAGLGCTILLLGCTMNIILFLWNEVQIRLISHRNS